MAASSQKNLLFMSLHPSANFVEPEKIKNTDCTFILSIFFFVLPKETALAVHPSPQ